MNIQHTHNQLQSSMKIVTALVLVCIAAPALAINLRSRRHSGSISSESQDRSIKGSPTSFLEVLQRNGPAVFDEPPTWAGICSISGQKTDCKGVSKTGVKMGIGTLVQKQLANHFMDHTENYKEQMRNHLESISENAESQKKQVHEHLSVAAKQFEQQLEELQKRAQELEKRKEEVIAEANQHVHSIDEHVHNAHKQMQQEIQVHVQEAKNHFQQMGEQMTQHINHMVDRFFVSGEFALFYPLFFSSLLIHCYSRVHLMQMETRRLTKVNSILVWPL